MQFRWFSIGFCVVTATVLLLLGLVALPAWPEEALRIELVMCGIFVAHLVVMSRLIMAGPYSDKE